MVFRFLAVVMTAFLLSNAAKAENISAENPFAVMKEIRLAGHTAEMSKDDGGDPMIQAKTGEFQWTVLFYNCQNAKRCKSIQFYTWFTKPKPSLKKINEWNASNRFGRAYLDKAGDPILEMDLDLDKGGISKELFVESIKIWDEITTSFSDHVHD